MRKYSNRSLRSLKGIHPDLRRVIDRALQESPLDFIVIEGLRTRERQAQLVASGASQTMNSRHITGHAVDLLPIGPSGPAFDWPLYHKLGPAVKNAARAEGVDLEWGGDWRTFADGPHFQLSHESYPASEWKTGEVFKERTIAQSTTLQAAGLSGAGVIGGAGAAISALDGTAQLVVIGAAILAAAGLAWIARERIRKWAAGDR